MAHNHEFDCPICGEHLDSRDQLNRHRERAHAQEGRGAERGARPTETGRDAGKGKGKGSSGDVRLD